MSTKRNWFYLFTTNLLSLCNANFLKHCIIFISITWALPEWITRSQLIALESAALVIPYLFLSPLSGKLAKTRYKTDIMKIMKAIELPIILIAIVAFYMQNVMLALVATLLLGTQACLYSPAKYGLIKDVDGERGAAFGSGMFEAMAFAGVFIGTIAASFIADFYTPFIVSIVLILLTVFSYFTATSIKVTEDKPIADSSSINPIKYVVDCHNKAKKFKGLNSAIFGASFFWFIGGLLQMNVVLHCTETMGLSNTISGLVLSAAATGIAVGCFVAGKIVDSFKNINKLRNIGLVGLICGSLIMALTNLSTIPTAIIVFLTAVSGGFFQVPCLTTIQRTPLGREFSIIMAYTNMMTFIFILLASAIFSGITLATNESSSAVFLAIAVLCGVCLTFLHYNERAKK